MAKRIYYLDILRILATLAVLFNHIPLAAIDVFKKDATNVDRWIVHSDNHIVHFAVPLFVMITGALLLKPERKIDYRKVFTKYVWRMVVITALVGTVYAWMEIYFKDKHFSLIQIPQALLNTWEGHTWKHMWYLYMLIGLYLVTPVLKAIVNYFSQKELDCLICVGLFFTSIWQVMVVFYDLELGIKFPVMSVYVFYMLLGYRLSDTEFRMRKPLVIAVVAIIVSLYVISAYMEHLNGYIHLRWWAVYESPLMVIYSALIFIIFKEMNVRYEKILTTWGGVNSRETRLAYMFSICCG